SRSTILPAVIGSTSRRSANSTCFIPGSRLSRNIARHFELVAPWAAACRLKCRRSIRLVSPSSHATSLNESAIGRHIISLLTISTVVLPTPQCESNREPHDRTETYRGDPRRTGNPLHHLR